MRNGWNGYVSIFAFRVLLFSGVSNSLRQHVGARRKSRAKSQNIMTYLRDTRSENLYLDSKYISTTAKRKSIGMLIVGNGKVNLVTKVQGV